MGKNIEQSKQKNVVENEKERIQTKVELMTLKELGKLSKEELLGIVNEMGRVNNKSSLEVMNKYGYDFTYAQLEVIAQYAGFFKDSGSSREVHYIAEGIEEASDKKEDLGLRDEIFDTARDKKSIKRTPIFMFPDDAEKFKAIVDKHSFFGLKEAAQAVIFKRLMNGEKVVE